MPLDGNTDLRLEDLDSYCPDGANDVIYAMAHAAVRKPDGSGGFQTETGWGDGTRVLEKGTWATRTEIMLEVACGTLPPPPGDRGDETAIMYGSIGFDLVLSSCLDSAGNLKICLTRWRIPDTHQMG